ncbi:MAG: c-type cytochrome [Ignavibacteria bacterium]
MFFINEITLPFSYNYSIVLQLVSILAHSMLYFYIFWLTGTALLSYYFEFFKRDDASTYMARVLINFPLKRISIPVVLGLIPFFVVYSIDLIWLTGEEFASLHYWSLVNFFLFTISFLFLYSYKSTFELVNLLSRTVTDKESVEYLVFIENNLIKHRRSAVIGVIGIILSLFLFSILSIAKLDYTRDAFRFDIFSYLINGKVYIRFLYHLTISLSLVFLGNLFFNFGWAETKLNVSEGLSDFIKTKSLKGAVVTILLQPAFILIELLMFPSSSLSYLIFLSSGFAVVLIFIVLNQLNAYGKENLEVYLRFSFFLFVVILISVSTRDVVSIANVLKPKIVEIDQKFLAYEENLKSKLNIQTIAINGEDIFSAKCSACHKFDAKLVGPPYNVVLKKYENNRDQLVKFILNPVKVDPAYPPMPAQGLIPTEAEAVADYILKVYKENLK